MSNLQKMILNCISYEADMKLVNSSVYNTNWYVKSWFWFIFYLKRSFFILILSFDLVNKFILWLSLPTISSSAPGLKRTFFNLAAQLPENLEIIKKQFVCYLQIFLKQKLTKNYRLVWEKLCLKPFLNHHHPKLMKEILITNLHFLAQKRALPTWEWSQAQRMQSKKN